MKAAFLLCFALLASLAPLSAAQAINPNATGLFAYMSIGGSVNLTRFSTYAGYQNSSGLFPTGAPVTSTANFVEGDVWFVSGNYGAEQCYGLPYLQEDSVGTSERSPVCSSRWGFMGGNYEHQTIVDSDGTFMPGCGGSGCAIFPVRVRVRADGWAMAYTLKDSVRARAALSRWRTGGAGDYAAVVDDTILGTAIERTLQVLNGSGSASITSPYSASQVNYYDFEFSDATSLYVGGRGAPKTTYVAGSYGFGFNPGSRQVKHMSLSLRTSPLNNWYVNGVRLACDRYWSWPAVWADGSYVPQTVVYRVDYGDSGPPTCGDAGGNSRPGNPFFAFPVNLTTFHVLPNTFTNVTSDGNYLKVAMWVYLA